jgi:hypothetical protein
MAKNSRNVSMFRAQFDRNLQVRKRLQDAVAALAKLGPEEWRNERELIDMAKVSTKDIGDHREHFSKHIVEVPSVCGRIGVVKRIWFANPKVAAKVRIK